MKKRISQFMTIAALTVLLGACAGQQLRPSADQIRQMAEGAGASNFYGATSSIGSAAGSLDSIDGTNLATGDGAYVITPTEFFIHYLNATSGAAESDPDVISPDANAGNKRWELVFQGNAKTADIAQLTPTDGNVIVGNGTTWVAESGATARTSLGVAIGSDVQGYHAALASIAGLSETNGGLLYGSADNTYAWLAAGAITDIFVGGGAGPPVWTTATGTGAPVRADSSVLSTQYTMNALIVKQASQTVADEAEITLATGVSGWGFAQAGDNEQWIQFTFTAAGVVTVIANSALAVNTDTDGNLCVYDAGSGIAIKNRLGSSKTIRYAVNYSA